MDNRLHPLEKAADMDLKVVKEKVCWKNLPCRQCE